MRNLGFEHYDEVPGTVKPTVQEMIAALSQGQRSDIINGFVKETYPDELSHQIFINKGVIETLYRGMKGMRDFAKKRMRGEILITGPVYGEDGEITIPAVYNTPPTTSGALVTQVVGDLDDEYTNTQVTAVLTRMVKESRHDGSGTWAYFRAEVVK